MAANAFPPQPPLFQWNLWTDSTGVQHKCVHQKLWASCVPACMAMLVRSISSIKEAYEEESARGALRAIIGPKQYQVFSDTGISLKYVPEAIAKAGVKNAMFVSGATVHATYCVKYFSAENPGIVGVQLTANGKNYNHAMLCKGDVGNANGDILFICPAYGPHEISRGNIAGGFQVTDQWNLGTPSPASATLTGNVVRLI